MYYESQPRNIQEGLKELDRRTPKAYVEIVANYKPAELWKCYRTVGSFVEKVWLKEGAPLRMHLEQQGIRSVEDMRALIVVAFYRRVRKKEIPEDKLIKELYNFWKTKHKITTKKRQK